MRGHAISGPGGVGSRTWLAFAVIAAAAVILLQVVSADLTFIDDDWEVLGERSLDPVSLLTPYNEHLSAIPIAILVVLRDTVGLGPHWLYLLIVHITHVVAAAGVLVIASRRLSATASLAFAGAALFLGSGWENTLWAFQVGAVVSVATGVSALAFLDAPRPRNLAASILVACALASSSFGLPFAGAAAILAILRRDRWAAVALVIVGLAYAAWYAIYHWTGPTLCLAPTPTELAQRAAPFGLGALVYAVGAPLGIGTGLQAAVPIAAGAATLWVLTIFAAIRAGRGPHLALASLAGILFMGLLVAWGRGCLGPQATGASRYVYVTGILALVAIAATPAVGTAGRLVAARRPVVWGMLLALAFLLNLRALLLGHDGYRSSSDTVRAVVQVLFDDANRSCHTSPARVDSVTTDIEILPTPARVRELVGGPGTLRAPAWTNADPDPALVAEVRHVMCDLPPATGP